MLIGNRYSEDKMYRGIKHYDKMPLTSADIHEYADIVYKKNAYLMNNLLGYGLLNDPGLSLNESAEDSAILTGISLNEPAVVMLDGDIILIHNDSTELISMSDITLANYSDGVVGIIGWYQSITAGSTMHSYGGLENPVIENDIPKSSTGVQISSRFQFKWFPVIISKENSESSTISIEIVDRDSEGNKKGTKSIINSANKVNDTFIFNVPESMEDYTASSKLYFIPLINYHYEEGTVTSASMSDKLSVNSQSLIISESEPVGAYIDGTEWFNPTTREFKKYITSLGTFIDNAAKMTFLQYQSIYTVQQTEGTPNDIVVPVGISQFEEGDILRVIYEGLELAKDLHYTIDYSTKSITLKEFTTRENDNIYFTVTKIVEASDITNITDTFVSHMNLKSSSTIEGHVKLSDTLSSSGIAGGIAATPKMVNTLKTSIDESLSSITESLESTQSNFTELVEDLEFFVSSYNNTMKIVYDSYENHNNKLNNLSGDISSINSDISELQSNSNIIKDSTTMKNYKFGIDDGMIYLEEV